MQAAADRRCALMHAAAVGDGVQRPHDLRRGMRDQTGRRRSPTEQAGYLTGGGLGRTINLGARRLLPIHLPLVAMGITIIAKFTPKPVSSFVVVQHSSLRLLRAGALAWRLKWRPTARWRCGN